MIVKEYTQAGLKFIKVINSSSLDVTFCDFGASFYDIHYLGDPMILSCKNVLDFLKPGVYYGKTIGRVAGRINNSVAFINNVPYYLANVGVKRICLHGGMFGLSTQRFTYELDVKDHEMSLTFKYYSMHLESGFPGNMTVKVIYKMYDFKNDIDVKFIAISDQDTLCNLTNHAYFNLGEASNNHLYLKMDADRFIEVNQDMIPICEKHVDDIRDFSSFKCIGEHVNNDVLNYTDGYDQHFLFKKDAEKVIQLKGERYQLKITTDYDGAQIYSDNFNNVESITSDLFNHRSVAIEPEDSHLLSHLLKANQQYVRNINYHFEVLNKNETN